ncbi:MAG: M20/M25/M40 family metallo-hydrolase, partial [Gammaproteobacteria bacterium]
MKLRIIFGLAGVTVAILLAVVTVRTILVNPPPQPDIAPVKDIIIDKGAAAKRLARAVQFRTISHGPDAPVAAAAFRGLHDFIRGTFVNVHKHLKRETVNELSLLYTWEGTDPSLKPILLLAHMDVVPVEPGTEKSWTHSAFDGAVSDGFVWGRGTMDMKASMMGILEAVEYLLAKSFAPKRTVYLAFGHDEEIGGYEGAAKIAALLQARRVRFAFTLDEGLVVTHGLLPGVEKPVALIGIAEKGIVTLKLSAHGPGGHGSMPPPYSAIARLGRALARLEDQPMPVALRAPVARMFDHVMAEMPLS